MEDLEMNEKVKDFLGFAEIITLLTAIKNK